MSEIEQSCSCRSVLPLQVRGLQSDRQLQAAGRAPSRLCDAPDRCNEGRLASAQLLCMQSMAKCGLRMLLLTQCACRARVPLAARRMPCSGAREGKAVCGAGLNTPANIGFVKRFTRQAGAVLQ